MAKKRFIDKYLKGNKSGGKKKSKSISFDESVLEALTHNAKVLNVSLSVLVQDAVIELGLSEKIDPTPEQGYTQTPPYNTDHTTL